MTRSNAKSAAALRLRVNGLNVTVATISMTPRRPPRLTPLLNFERAKRPVEREDCNPRIDGDTERRALFIPPSCSSAAT